MKPLLFALLILGPISGSRWRAPQASGTVTPPPTGIFGDWKSTAGSIVRVEHCGAQVCLALVQLIHTNDITTDVHNPDPALRTRPLCDLHIGTGFTLVDSDHAIGGTLYDPKTGKTYRGSLAADGGRLRLRGYIGIPLFGESQTWTRPTQPVVPCGAG
jgi:uncharacterized protein (DUF2147 family)